MAARALRAIIRDVEPIAIFLIESKVVDEIVSRVMKAVSFSFFLFSSSCRL